MDPYLALAGGLTILLALVHSLGGELFLFPRLTGDSLPPLPSDQHPLRRPFITLFGTTGDRGRRLLRSVWHVPTALGLGIGVILLRLAWSSSSTTERYFILTVLGISIGACALIMLAGVRGRHPGWVVFLIVALLIGLARMSTLQEGI